MKKQRILLTGATGFIGRALHKHLINSDYSIKACARSLDGPDHSDELILAPPLDDPFRWLDLVLDCQTVIHLAARVHVMNDVALDPLEQFRHTNVRGTLNLAKQSAKAGVKRFIYLSSVKACGESTSLGDSFNAESSYHPEDAYGISKMEAEIGLLDIADSTGMEVVIVRLPLVYGAGVKANFASLLRIIEYRIPLPFGLVRDNRRSFVGIDNLINFIEVCISHPNAANQIFMVCDGDDMSTADLIERLGFAMSKPVYLINIPLSWLKLIAHFFVKKTLMKRLLGSLQVDISKNYELLGWVPPFSVKEGFDRLFSFNE